MKKLLSVLLATVLLLTCVPLGAIPVFAATSGTTGDCTWTLNGTHLTISGNGAMGDYWEASPPWRMSITSVTIEDGVTTIGGRAFSGQSLTSVTIPNSVTTIGNSAFYYCMSLTSVTIPNSVTTIENYAFSYCTSLTSVTIGNSVTTIGFEAFWCCESLASVTIPDSVTNIGSRAFRYCDSLTSVTIPDSVTTIGDCAFSDCDSLTSIDVDENNSNYCDVDGVLFNKRKTMLLQCPSGKRDTYIIIPNSVTTIGNSAFSNCDSLMSITIPNSVTTIWYGAFSGCDSLTSVTIPDSVTTIENYAFSDCTALTSVTIPESVTTIERSAFSDCTALKSVTIPNSVTTIGDYAFSDCTALKSVTIGDSVITIGNGAFSYCTALTSVTIGNSVTTIGEYAFYRCDALTSVTIPNSVTTIGNYAFRDCTSLADVYYNGTKSQWESISIGSANSNLLNATMHYKSTGPISGSVVASSPKYTVKVVDADGYPIPRATVTIIRSDTIDTYTTDMYGLATFDRDYREVLDFVVTAEGYDYDHTFIGKDFSISKTGVDVVTLYSSGEGTYKISKAIYHNTDSSYNTASGPDVDLVKSTKRLSLTNDGRGYFQILCSTPDASQVEKYILYQDGNIIKTSTDGKFNLKISDFTAGKDIYVTVVGKGSQKVTTPLNLEICDDEKYDEFSVSFGDNLSVQVPDSIPFLGGTNLECNIPDLPLKMVVDEGTLYLGLNVELNPDSKEKSVQEQYKEIKELVEDARKLKDYALDSEFEKKLNKFIKKRDGFNLPAAGKIKATLFGCGSTTLLNSGAEEIKMEAYLLIDAYVEQDWQFVAWVVPVTVNIKVGVEGKFGGELEWNQKDDTLNGDFAVTITPYLEAFAGIGISKFIGVGVHGGAEAPMEIQLFGTSISPGLNYVDLIGELSLKAFLGSFSAEKVFAYNVWHVYTRTGAVRRSAESQPYYAELYDSDNYKIDDVSYLQNQSAWLGERGESKLLANQNEVEAIDIRPLLLDTYRNLQPSIAATDKDAVMVFIGADAQREAQNAPTLMYSVYDAKTGTWSAPLQVDGNRTADTAPMLYSDGETIRVVYQDATMEYDADVTVDTYIKTQNVSVYAYDSQTGSFVPEQVFTADEISYRAPLLTDVNGTPAMVWVASANSDMFGQGDDNTLLYSYYQNGAWTAPAVLADGLCTLVDYTVGATDGELSVLFVADADNDLITDDDRYLVKQTTKGNVTIYDGAVSNLDFVQLPDRDEQSFVWVDGGTLCTLNELGEIEEVCSVGSPESIAVIGNKILFTSASRTESGEANSEIFAVIYDETTDAYGNAVALSSQEKYIEKLDAVVFDGIEILTMTRKLVEITDGSVNDACEFAWAVLNDYADLSVNSVEYDYDDIQDGEIPLYVSLTNNGAATAEGYTLSVLDGNYDVVICQTINETILAGETKSFVVMMPLDNVTEVTEYLVSVNVEDGAKDDAKPFVIGYADLEVFTESIKVGNQNTLVCTVENKGLSPISGELLVYENVEENEVLTAHIETLAPGEKTSFVVELTSQTIEKVLTCTVKADAQEYSEVNNTETVYFDFSVFTESECLHEYEVTITGPYCGDNGTKTYTCVCGDSYSEPVLHSYSNEYDADCNICGAIREVPEKPVKIIYGDADGDGEVTSLDVVLLQQHFAGYEVTLDEAAADADGDGEIAALDVVILQQFFAGYEVTLGPPD